MRAVDKEDPLQEGTPQRLRPVIEIACFAAGYTCLYLLWWTDIAPSGKAAAAIAWVIFLVGNAAFGFGISRRWTPLLAVLIVPLTAPDADSPALQNLEGLVWCFIAMLTAIAAGAILFGVWLRGRLKSSICSRSSD